MMRKSSGVLFPFLTILGLLIPCLIATTSSSSSRQNRFIDSIDITEIIQRDRKDGGCCQQDYRCFSDHIQVSSLMAKFKEEQQQHPGKSANDFVVFGTQHKSGSRLGKLIHASLFNTRDVQDHIEPELYVPGRPFVLFIRDPLEMIVSGYQFHLVTDEKWVKGPGGYQERLRNASLVDGLEMEYSFATKTSIKSLIKTFQLIVSSFSSIKNDTQEEEEEEEMQEEIFIVRMENTYDKTEFLATMVALQKFLGFFPLNATKMEECCYIDPKVHKTGGTNDGDHHVSKGDEKPRLREIVMARHADAIQSLRVQLGYPPDGIRVEMLPPSSSSSSRDKQQPVVVVYQVLLVISVVVLLLWFCRFLHLLLLRKKKTQKGFV